MPGIIAGVSMVVFEDYLSVKYCWIAPRVGIYMLAIPVGIILVLNIGVAIFTIYSMTCGFKVGESGASRVFKRGPWWYRT